MAPFIFVDNLRTLFSCNRTFHLALTRNVSLLAVFAQQIPEQLSPVAGGGVHHGESFVEHHGEGPVGGSGGPESRRQVAPANSWIPGKSV